MYIKQVAFDNTRSLALLVLLVWVFISGVCTDGAQGHKTSGAGIYTSTWAADLQAGSHPGE